MTNKVKTTRNLKVIEQSGYRYQATPTVMLKGKWLSEFSFDIGTHVKVEFEDGRLIITKEEARDEIVQPVLCVAEGKAGYGKKRFMEKTNEIKYFEDPKQNAAFLRCVDLLAGLIEKYADVVLLPDKEYQLDYVVTVADVTYLIEFTPRISRYKLMELYSKKSRILHSSRLLNKKSVA